LYAIATNGTKVDLSEQYVLQCDSSSFGCSGGYPYTALNLAKTGIPLESKYSYQAAGTYQKSVICN
jgi:hypothetical protein